MKLSAMNLTKKFHNTIAVNDFEYTFENGIYGLLGPNGSGKSTLMRMLCDILSPSAGEVTLDGVAIRKLDAQFRDLLGYLPQNFGYYPQFTAYDFLMYFAALKGFQKKDARVRVQQVLEKVSLMDVKKHKIKTFSGGMKQRLGIAQALLNDPKILIVDEPTAGLDPKERTKFKNILARCAHDKIVILSTHIVSDIENIARNVIIMKEGNIHNAGTRDELLQPLQGKVYSFLCEEKQVEEKTKDMIVTAMMPAKDKILIRGIIEHCMIDAHEEVPSLEDLYLDIFHEETSDALV